MIRDSLTRRRILAAVGSVSVLSATARVGRASLGLDRVEFTTQTQIRQAASLPPVLLRWRETYNGSVLETPSQPTADPVGPVIDVGGIVPGDEGSLTIEAELGQGADSSNQALVKLFAAVYENSDNRVNEPERDAGDDPDDPAGELAAAIDLEVRYDDGCNATDIPLLPDDPKIASGNAFDVEQALSGVVLRSPSSGPCFTAGDSTCLTLTWKLPADVGNEVQTDSLGLRLGFVPEQCPEGTR